MRRRARGEEGRRGRGGRGERRREKGEGEGEEGGQEGGRGGGREGRGRRRGRKGKHLRRRTKTTALAAPRTSLRWVGEPLPVDAVGPPLLVHGLVLRASEVKFPFRVRPLVALGQSWPHFCKHLEEGEEGGFGRGFVRAR